MQGVLRVVEEHRPLHLSLVGGDPLVRYRELLELLPELDRRGIHVQLVTSAFREIPAQWNALSRLNIVVSVDGLQPEHDIRRKPATYERILKCIAHSHVSIHCTITSQMMQREGYLEEFVKFWSLRRETKRIWFSIFTPQKGRHRSRDPDRAGADAHHCRTSATAGSVSAARHARLGDQGIRPPASFTARLHLREHYDHHFGGSEDSSHSLPIRRRSRLFAVRLHCQHGPGRNRPPPTVPGL